MGKPITKNGRHEQKRLQQDTELAAEKQPRTQAQWSNELRRSVRLPTADGPVDGKVPGDEAPHEEGKEPGRKKVRRLAVLQGRKQKKEQKKAAAAQKAVRASAEALKGKIPAKDINVCEAAAELLKSCPAHPAAQQQLMASVAERISGDPEKDIELFDVFFELHRKGGDSKTRQLALLSAAAIFKDLVPGYRIRELSEQEKSVQLSKEVLARHKYEMNLLQNYRRLLPLMETAMKREPVVFAPALAALLKSAFDFNFRQRVIGIAVGHTCSPIAAVRRTLADGLQDMFEGDMRLEASREAVLAVGRVAQRAAASAAKRRRPGSTGTETRTDAAEVAAGVEASVGAGGAERPLRHELLKALLRIPVGRAEAAALHGDTGHGTDAAGEDVHEGLLESSTKHKLEHLRKAEAELLYEIFVVYLRILRQRHIHGRELLTAVLAGLGHWGQHVNLELLLEILGELRYTVQDAIGRSDGLVSLQGLNCALQLLSGSSQALVTDATWLADAMTDALALALPSLYRVHSESALWPPARSFSLEGRHLAASQQELSRALETESGAGLVLRCLEAALRCPQGYGKASDAALATLFERLFLLAAGADPHVSLALLREVALVMRRHQRLCSLLDAEGGLFGLGGVTDHAISVLWHLQPLAFSLSPELAKASRALPATIPQRRTPLLDLFPAKDAAGWMEAEFTRHIAALAKAPKPHSSRFSRSGRRTAAFLSEAELRAACSCSKVGVHV